MNLHKPGEIVTIAKTATHVAPHTGKTHRGTLTTCTEYPCAPQRDAHAILREDDPRTPAEQAALDAVDARRWVLWHADDYATGTVLLLSRAGLLRDTAHEEQQGRATLSDKAWRDRRQTADRQAIAALTELAELAAGRLEAGDDPAEVAAQLRDLASRIGERRDHQSSPTAPESSSREVVTA
jgi:hypothetical protein